MTIKQFFALCAGLCLLFSSMICSANNHYPFRQQEISFGFYNHGFINTDLPKPPSPIFWDAEKKADSGYTLMYQRFLWHSQRYFSLNWGANIARYRSDEQNLYSASVFLALRVWFLRDREFRPYFVWSVAGPSWISRRVWGSTQLGEHFIFQDFIGLGAEFGAKHVFDASIKIVHYSNGDLFTQNSGFEVPVVISLGYVF